MEENFVLDTASYQDDLRYIRECYGSLNKKEKSEVVRGLQLKFGLNYYTLMQKFRGTYNFTVLEVQAISGYMRGMKLCATRE